MKNSALNVASGRDRGHQKSGVNLVDLSGRERVVFMCSKECVKRDDYEHTC